MSSPAPPTGPEVLVVEGGRQLGDPPSAGSPPRLVLAPAPPPEDDGTGGASRFIRVEPAPAGIVQDEGSGRIFVDASAPDQTLFVGAGPGAYRLDLRLGAVWVRPDDRPPVRLQAGQTLDVQARCIFVSQASTAAAEGRYLRLDR